MTKAELIEKFRAEYPELFEQVNDEKVALTGNAYEAKLAEWADNVLANQAEENKKQAEKEALLNRLGITEDEAKLLLG